MALDARTRRVLESYQRQNDDLVRRVLQFVSVNWDALSSHRDADIAEFVARVSPVVEGGQAQMSRLTVAYLIEFERALRGEVSIAATAVDVTTEALRGVPGDEVLRRAGVQVWTDLANGRPYSAAVQSGRNRITSIVSTDLQLAKTHTARAAIGTSSNVVGHRRVLKGAYDCAKCVVASTQRYRKARLQPIHPGCNCDVAPIFGDVDPGQIIDPDALDNIHERIAAEFGESSEGARGVPGRAVEYQDVLVVNNHGEIGPVLGVRGHDFTSAADLDL